eukprot:gene13955-6996_t
MTASMSRAHEKMLREVYFQKLARQKEHKRVKERDGLAAELKELRQQQQQQQQPAIAQSRAAQQAGMTKMLREVYLQKLQRQKEHKALVAEVAQLRAGGRRDISQSRAAQQAGMTASLSRAHEKMLREVYLQKLQRQKEHKRLVAENRELRLRAPSVPSPPPHTPVCVELGVGGSSANGDGAVVAGLRRTVAELEKQRDALRARCSDLDRAAGAHWDVAARSYRRDGAPDLPFHVAAVQVYEGRDKSWSDFESIARLAPDAQLFCFQPESPWHPDVGGAIPPACEDAVAWVPAGTAPRRGRTAASQPPASGRATATFRLLGRGGVVVRLADFDDGLRRACMSLRCGTAAAL